MGNLDLGQALRYLYGGVLILSYWAWIDLRSVGEVADSVTNAGLFAIVLALGALSYNAYRATFYNMLIRHVVDALRSIPWVNRWAGGCARNYLREMLRRESRIAPGRNWTRSWGWSDFWDWFRVAGLYSFMSDQLLGRERTTGLRLWGASIHMFYLASLVSLSAWIATGCVRWSDMPWQIPALAFLIFGLAGLATDLGHGRLEVFIVIDALEDDEEKDDGETTKDKLIARWETYRNAHTSKLEPQEDEDGEDE